MKTPQKVAMFLATTALTLGLVGTSFAQPADASKPKDKPFRLVPPPATFTPPTLEVGESTHDWGTVLQGELVEHTFTLKNIGGAPLIVSRIKPSCGCTTVKKPEKPIEPGETEVVTIRVDTKRLRNKTKKTASIFSNDPASPTKVSMEGVVEELFQRKPQLPRITILRGSPSEPLEIELSRKPSDTPVRVVEVTSKGPILDPKLVEVEAGRLYKIIVTAVVTEDRKFYQETLTVKVDRDGEKQLEIPIPVSITVKERIHVEPRSSVYFNRKDTQKLAEPDAAPLEKQLEIKSLGGEDHKFKILGVENAGTHFATAVETVEEGRHYRLTISLKALPTDTRQKRINEKLLIKTDDASVPELKITALAAIK